MKRRILLLVVVSAFGLTGRSPVRAGQEKGAPLTADEEAVVRGNNEFAFDLYRRLARKEGNLVFSPYSISTALAMTYAGARGETADEMAKVLHFTLGRERLHPAFGATAERLRGDGKPRPFLFLTANALWGQRGLGFRDEFLSLTRECYGAGLREVDFAGDAEGSRRSINRWVEEQTQKKILEILKPGDVGGSTRLVLTNALYLKATWEMPFDKKRTKEARFEVSPERHVAVPMMQAGMEIFNYFEGAEFGLLELPYKGRQLSMIVLLPRKKWGLPGVEKSLTAAGLAEAISKLHPHAGDVALPRFLARSRLLLNEELKALGMPKAFGEGADFSGIAGGRGLRVGLVVHDTFTDVDEVGTEAASATAVGLPGLAVPTFSFRADHPFLFLIRERPTGNIFFIGRVADPKK